MGRLEGKVAIVTGGSRGIGKAVSALFAKEGAKVVIGARNVEVGNRAAAEINARYPSSTMFCPLEVTSLPSWKEVIAQTIDRFGKLNILVNNAGNSIRKNIMDTTDEDWNVTIGIHMTGGFYGMREAIAAMKDNGEPGSIINLSSIEGLITEGEFFAYCAAKGGVVTMTKAAAVYCAEAGLPIRINAVHPGYIATEMLESEAAQKGQTYEQYAEGLVKRHPVGHLGDVDDVAYGILYLASDESRFTTGSSLVIDGGYTAV
jgi:NAD(P)-dependent dehydrogenase (short-subunit alcohol dehydrogenase family)